MPGRDRNQKRPANKTIKENACHAALLSLLICTCIVIVAAAVFPAPAYAGANLTLSAQSGLVGSNIELRGENFSGSLAAVYWDEAIIAEDVPVSAQGTILYTIEIPHAARGEHTIFISDDSNWSESTASVSFEVLPSIKVFPPMGEPQTQLTVTGNGFDKYETNISITVDGTVVSSTLTSADAFGTWSISYILPNISRGEHLFGAQGSTTYAGEVDEVVFLVTPWSKIEPVAGQVGSKTTLWGHGFSTSEVGISISWDDEVIMSGLTADTGGSIVQEIEVPPSSYGKHAISIFGKLYTLKGKVPKSYFEVLPSLTVEPDTAAIDERVTIKGAGFTAKDRLTFTFDQTEITPPLRSDDLGSFRTSFIVPQTTSLEHMISVSDSKGNTAQASLNTVKFAATSSPTPLAPVQDQRFAVFYSIGRVYIDGIKYLFGKRPLGLTGVDFDWSLDRESGEERYVLQIARGTSFDRIALEKETESISSYTLSQADALPPGKYQWRIKVIDSMGKESPWSEAASFEVILVPIYIAVLSAVLLLLFIAAVVLGIRVAWASSSYR